MYPAPVIREDYLLRLIKDVADFVRRVMKMRVEQQDPQRALDQIAKGYEDLLGLPPGLADIIDAGTMASLLRTPERIRAAAALSREEGHAYAAMRDPFNATSRYRRAHRLLATAHEADPQPEDDAEIAELARLAGE
jgi:hypothetical protein